MQPVICAMNVTALENDTISKYPVSKYCFVNMNSVDTKLVYSNELLPISASLAIPIFHHYQYCTCENGKPMFNGQEASSCQDFDFISSLIMFGEDESLNVESYADTLTAENLITTRIFELISNYSNEDMIKLAYQSSPISYYGDYHGQNLGWCSGCSVMSLNSFVNPGTPSAGYGGSVSNTYYQLLTGACSDTLSTSSWSQLAVDPPSSLTESYFRCRPLVTTALVSSVGIANGFTSTLLPFILFILLPAAYYLLRVNNLLPAKVRV